MPGQTGQNGDFAVIKQKTAILSHAQRQGRFVPGAVPFVQGLFLFRPKPVLSKCLSLLVSFARIFGQVSKKGVSK